jgi:PE family
MSFISATPEYLAAAASDLANIASTLSSANAAALGPTSSVLAAGADEVSATIAALFDSHAAAYQALSAQAALFHQQFVNIMSGCAAQYALTEAANASPLQTVEQGALGVIGTPGQALGSAVPAAGGPSPAAAVSPGAVPTTFGPGITGVTAQLASSPVAAPGVQGSFGTGGAGFTGGLLAAQNFGSAPAAGPSGLAGSVAAVEGAEEVGLGAAPAAVVPDTGISPLAAVPAAAPVGSSAAVRPATPAYSPATASAAEPAEE